MKNTRRITCLSLILTLLALFAAPAFAETAVSPEEFTLEMLAEANSHEKLMEKHSSYHAHVEYTGEISGGTYADSELFYTYVPNAAIVYADGQQCEINDETFAIHLYVGQEPNLEWTTGLAAYSPEEELAEVVQDGEKLIVKTRSSVLAYGEEIEDGYCEFIYEVDMQDLCFLDGSYTSYTPDGTVVFNAVWNVEYDVERPAQAQELLDRMNPQEDYRTVTVVADPGTEDETVYSVNSRRGDAVRLFCGDDYEVLYLDPECTEIYETGTSDPTQDLTLYVTKAGK